MMTVKKTTIDDKPYSYGKTNKTVNLIFIILQYYWEYIIFDKCKLFSPQLNYQCYNNIFLDETSNSEIQYPKPSTTVLDRTKWLN